MSLNSCYDHLVQLRKKYSFNVFYVLLNSSTFKKEFEGLNAMNTIKILSKNKRIRDTYKRIKRHNSRGKYI